jgi:hypothetical protein
VKYEKDSLRFFALTSTKQTGLTHINPLEAYNLFKSFGLDVVNRIEIADVSDVNKLYELNDSFQTEENSEGAVVYCANENGNIVWMYKHKNNDYVFRRAIREKMRAKAPISRIIDRIDNLHFIHPQKDELLAYYIRFYAWIMTTDLGITWDEVFSQWCTLEERFAQVSDEEEMNKIQPYISSVVDNWKVSHDSTAFTSYDMHVTLYYFNKKPDVNKEIDSYLKQLENTIVEIKVTGLAYDDKAIALVIESSMDSQNEIQHITLCVSEGTPPVYSNEMLKTPEEVIPLDISLNGVLVRQITMN